MATTRNIARPHVACEISADRMVAARTPENGGNLESASATTLPAGLLTPGLQQANITERARLVPSLRELLATVAGRTHDICLIIPDATTRVMLLDFETL